MSYDDEGEQPERVQMDPMCHAAEVWSHVAGAVATSRARLLNAADRPMQSGADIGAEAANAADVAANRFLAWLRKQERP